MQWYFHQVIKTLPFYFVINGFLKRWERAIWDCFLEHNSYCLHIVCSFNFNIFHFNMFHLFILLCNLLFHYLPCNENVIILKRSWCSIYPEPPENTGCRTLLQLITFLVYPKPSGRCTSMCDLSTICKMHIFLHSFRLLALCKAWASRWMSQTCGMLYNLLLVFSYLCIMWLFRNIFTCK